jgi:hypothetical protein
VKHKTGACWEDPTDRQKREKVKGMKGKREGTICGNERGKPGAGGLTIRYR